MKRACHMLWPKCSAEMTEGFIDNAKCPLYWKPQGYEEDIFSFYSESTAASYSSETAATCSAAV